MGDLVLGRQEFLGAERTSCCRRLAAAAGRRLTVVDTPGWWCDFGARDTAELVRREIASSPSLCPPGPHALLIAIKETSAFTERRLRAVEEHVALLGDGAWGHCVLVLVRARGSGRAEAEEVVRAGGGSLRRLSERCGRRCYCVELGGGGGVPELLEGVQRLVAQNGNRVFEMRGGASRAAAEEKRSVEERALRRLVRAKERRSLVRGEWTSVCVNVAPLLAAAKLHDPALTDTLRDIQRYFCWCR